jgi:hypothetical protein
MMINNNNMIVNYRIHLESVIIIIIIIVVKIIIRISIDNKMMN